MRLAMIGKILQSKMETLLSQTSTTVKTTMGSGEETENVTMLVLNGTRMGYGELQQGNASENNVLFEGYPAPLLHFATVCCVLFILLGIPGNLGTIIALYRCKKVRNATAVFIMNLSVSDLMFCCFNLPLAASTFYSRAWRHGHLLCQLFPLLRYGLLAVSLFTVLAITINRYVMIGHPTLYPKLYRKEYLGLMVACTWVCGFGALVATWLGAWGQFGLDREIGSCSILPDEQGRSPKAFLFIVAFVIPCISIVVCYARIFYIVRKTALKSRSVPRSANTSLAQASKLSTVERSTSTTLRKFLKSKTTSSCEDSAIGTSTTGASGTISTDRSSSVYFDNVHLRNGIDKSPNHFEKEIKQNIINSNQNQKLDLVKGKISTENNGYFVKPRENVHFLEHKLIPNPSFLYKKAFSDSKINVPESGDKLIKAPKQRNSLEYNNRKFYISTNPNGKEFNFANLSKSNPESPVHNKNGFKINFEGYNASPNRVNFEEVSNKNFLEPPSFAYGKKRSITSNVEDEVSTGSATPTSHSEELSKKGSKRKKRMPSVNLSNVFRRGSNSPSRRSSSMTNVAGKMTTKDKKLLKMILVIFLSFLICYLPITISKTFRHVLEIHTLNIAGYILIYLTTCMNPIIYVVMSSEYRQAYKNLLMCKSNEVAQQNRSGSQK